MPKYYLHLVAGSERIADTVGSEFPDNKAALEEAYRAAREMVAESVLNGDVIQPESIEVVDERGTLIESVPLKAVFRIQ
jgi:hypothetical protein